jgi:hypothetical protein
MQANRRYHGTLNLPDTEVQANLDGFVLSKYNLEILSRTTDTVRLQLSQELKGGSLKLGEFNSRAVKLDPKLSKSKITHPNRTLTRSLNHPNRPNRSKSKQMHPNRVPTGIPLPKEDQPVKKTSIRGKDSQDKTTGELLVSVIIGLFFVPGYLYCWPVRRILWLHNTKAAAGNDSVGSGSGNSRPKPSSPLEGEDRGGGYYARKHHPPSQPSPARGEGVLFSVATRSPRHRQ